MTETDGGPHRRIGSRTRRELMSGAAAVAAGGVLASRSTALARRRRPRSGRRVAVLGAGVAGLTAAQELAERGFDVTVYERNEIGGKSRTIYVPRSGVGGRRDLPGEHGFRLFAGFYKNIPDTFRRIPFGSNPNGVLDNLVAAGEFRIARAGGRADFTIPWPLVASRWSPENLEATIVSVLEHGAHLGPDELPYFARRLAVFMTSCDERRFGEWEHMNWWDFTRAERFSDDYQRLFASGWSRGTQAVYAPIASARSFAQFWEAFIYNITRADPDASDVIRLLNGPSTDAWIGPWVDYLRKLGVRFRVPVEVTALAMRGGRLAAASARSPRGRLRIDADWFVCALPVERARRLWNPKILRADPRLESMDRIQTEWMNGIQFFLDRRVRLSDGHVGYIDSPWFLGTVHQQQFWPDYNLAGDFGDGRVRDCLSVVISSWDDPGILYGKPAQELSPAQIANEAWAQIKAGVNDSGRPALTDDMVVSWFLDPSITPPRGGRRARNELPLFITTVSSWDDRPDAVTAIPNLFLASDYVRTSIDQATMEGANESARVAVGGLLDATGSRAPAPEVRRLFEPRELESAKRLDAELYRHGRPNLLDD